MIPVVICPHVQHLSRVVCMNMRQASHAHRSIAFYNSHPDITLVPRRPTSCGTGTPSPWSG